MDKQIDRLVYEASVKMGKERAGVIEEMITLHLQTKPKWLPKWVWLRLIKRLLIIGVDR